jgi:hypothetical protein
MTDFKKIAFLSLCIVFSIQQSFAQIPIKKDSTIVINDSSARTDDPNENLLDNIPVVSLDENDNQDGSAQNVSGQINDGRNPFISAASFNFFAVRFRIRGYDADLFSTNMNGVPMENLDNGFTPYGLWGGLNDVLRNRQYTPGFQANKLGFGDLGGFNFIDTRASKQRKQTTIGYALSNRNYVHRLNITHSTGFNKKGWAFSVSGSRRFANQGFTDGTFYDGWSAYVGIDKKINAKHLLSFVAFATPTQNGRQGSSVQEMLDIAGTNFYNPYWGYQNGQKRNASIAKSFQPIGIVTHEWKINPKTTVLTAASFLSGSRSTTGIDWYNAADPRPDYYRYLPSYQKDSILANQVLQALKSDVNKRQINWDALYNANYSNIETVQNADGKVGNSITGHRSLYILEERVIHTNKFNFNSTFNTSINKHIDLSGGLTYEKQQNNYYKKVNDLLGGDFYVDINQFAERDFPSNPTAGMNDVNNPNRILKVGDKFGYNYNMNIQRAEAWLQTIVKLKAFELFFSGKKSYTAFQREGNVKSGLFPNNSYGKSEAHRFSNFAAKAGINFKITTGNYLFLHGAMETKAPFFENAYLAPRNRDFVQDNLQSEEIKSVEGGYVLIAPTIKFRATGYYTQFKNITNVMTFYDDEARTFVNYALHNIGKVHYGVELGTEVILLKGLSFTSAAAIGRFRYNTRQLATTTADNNASLISKNVVVYSNNYYVPTPQEAYSAGLNYRSPYYWYVNLNFNYFDQMWLDFNPLRRTASAVNGVDPNAATWNNILDQTKLAPQHTLDFFGGYSWLLNNQYKFLTKRTFLIFNIGVNNILNNTNIVSGGFEQLRFDFAEKNIEKFPPKKFYAYGTNFFASIGLRF